MVSVGNGKRRLAARMQELYDLLGQKLRHEPARQMSAPLHEVEIVELFEFLPQEHLYRAVLLVMIEQNGVRKFQRRLSALLDAGREAGGNDLLRRADGRDDALFRGVLLEIDAGENAAADPRARRALGKDKTARQLGELIFFERRVHVLADGGDALFVLLAQIHFGRIKRSVEGASATHCSTRFSIRDRS